MPTYRVIEHIVYEVEAESEEGACQVITDDEERDRFFVECTERFAELVEPDTSAPQRHLESPSRHDR